MQRKNDRVQQATHPQRKKTLPTTSDSMSYIHTSSLAFALASAKALLALSTAPCNAVLKLEMSSDVYRAADPADKTSINRSPIEHDDDLVMNKKTK